MSGLLTSDYADPTTSNAMALGSVSPLGAPTPLATPKPAAVGKSVIPPEKTENNLTIAKRQREMGENRSRDPNAQNPYSSAGGADQIIDDTWMHLMRTYHPDLVEGKTEEQILALKSDKDLSGDNASHYDQENAKFLASNGIAPTPNFINAAYRAGPQGALAIIQAARTNPNTLVKDVAPDMATRGNNGAGNLTVGQFLMNPYARGPGAQNNDTPQQILTLSRGNQILQQQMEDFQSGRAKAQKIDKDYKPIDIPPMPKPPDTDPLKTFSSVAGLFAVLAAGFSRTPAIAAMNGLAGAMDAAKKSDWETYKAQYDQFKTSSELALKAHEQHSTDIRDALEMMTKNMAAGTAMMNATMALSNDEQMQKHMALGDYIAMGHLQDQRDEQARTWKLEQPVYEATSQLTAAMHNRDAAYQAGDPEAIKSADGLVTQAENRVAEVKRALAGGAKSSDLSTPQMVTLPGSPDQVPATFNKSTRQYEALDTGKPLPGAVPVGKGETPSTPEERQSAAAQASTGMPINQIAPGYGPGAVSQRKQIRADAIKKIMDDTGKSANDAGIELANRTIEFQSGKRSSSQLTTMLGATKQAVSQLDFNIDKTKQEMAKLPSTDLSPVLNAIARGEEKWTGDPAYSALFYYMHATALESARILAGGQASIAQLHQGAMEEAAKWANVNMTPASFDAVAKAMHDEGENRIQTFNDALKSQRVTTPGQELSSPLPGEVVHIDAQGNRAVQRDGKWVEVR